LDFVAIDFETACHIPSSACAVGVSKVIAGELTDSRQWLIRPLESIFAKYNVAIHQITPAMVESAPTFAELWPELRDYMGNNIIVAHNAQFDMNILYHSALSQGIKPPAIKSVCSITLARAAWEGLESYSLSALAGFLDMDLRNHHAQSDAEVCAKITLEACRALGFPDIKACYKCYPSKVGYYKTEINLDLENEEQHKRKVAAGQLVVNSISKELSSGVINGYNVTLTSCTCRDFQLRQKPCKHMYRLKSELEEPTPMEIEYCQLIEPGDYISFQSAEELERFISIFEFPKRCITNNLYIYKGRYANRPIECEIIGHKHHHTLVIEFKNSDAKRHCINGFYLKEMQGPSFKKEMLGETS
jgi:DNA polymerase-3 subunit epsilon